MVAKKITSQKVNIPNLVQLFKIGKDELELKFAGEIFAVMMQLYQENHEASNSVDLLIKAFAEANKDTYPSNSPLRWEEGEFDKDTREYKTLQTSTSNVLRKLRDLWLTKPEREGKSILYSLHLENLKVYLKAITEMNTFGSSEHVKEWLEPQAEVIVNTSSKNITILLSDEWSAQTTQWEQISLLELKELAQFLNLLNNEKTKNIITMLENPEQYVNKSIENWNRPHLWLTVQEIYVNKRIRWKGWEQQAVISNQLWILKELWLVNYRWTEVAGQPHEWKEHYYYLTEWARKKYDNFMKVFGELQTVQFPRPEQK